MTATWSYNGMKDQSKFSLDAVIRRIEKEGNKVTSVIPTSKSGGTVCEAIITYEPKNKTGDSVS